LMPMPEKQLLPDCHISRSAIRNHDDGILIAAISSLGKGSAGCNQWVFSLADIS